MSRRSGASGGLLQAVDETLELLDSHSGGQLGAPVVSEPLPSLLEQCQRLCAEITAKTEEPIRTIHHFACTGGTLISKQLAVMPNTQVLSELDPFSQMPRPAFAPSDLIWQLRNSAREVDETLLADIFLSGLSVLYEHATTYGTRLVLRDHTHSHFCVDQHSPGRPTFLQLVQQRFSTCSVLTTRHPLDSYLSLRANGWVSFSPKTFDEYCHRYLDFLAAYRGARIFKYEDFVADPAQTIAAICRELQLPFSPDFLDLSPAVHLSGDSGRRGAAIRRRKRRPVPEQIAEEAQHSSNYHILCTQLGYEA